MQSDVVPKTDALDAACVRIPQHVVHRSFPAETVVLNLQTGQYHGLNTTAGRMLQELERAASVADAITALERIYDQPREVLEGDVRELCQALRERGLIEVDGGWSQ
jgi:Coenzyme PQQ synthesis protein D (PqqD)